MRLGCTPLSVITIIFRSHLILPRRKAMNMLLYIPLFLAVYVLTKHLFHKIRNLPPTPFLCFPIIGHLYLLRKPFHRTLANLSEAYGPLLHLRLGTQPVIIVSSPRAAKECLRQHNGVRASMESPLQLQVGKIIGHGNASLLSTPFGEHWRTLRRILASDVFYSGCFQLLSKARDDEVKSLIYRLYKQTTAVQGNDRTVEVEVKTVMFELTYRVLMRMIAGDEWCSGDSGKRFGKVLQEMLVMAKSTSIIVDYVPFLRKIGLAGSLVKTFGRLYKESDRLLQDVIEEQRSGIMDGDDHEGSTKKNNKTIIQVLLSLQQKDPENHTDDIIKGLVLAMLLAGTDACLATMEWTLSLLLNNPTTQYKAQAEIDQHVGHDRLIDKSDLRQLRFLDCIFNETMRMYPVGPLLVPYESSRDRVVEGYNVPNGTILMFNVWAINNHPMYWDEPTNFRPERFEGSDEKNSKTKLMGFGSRKSGILDESVAILTAQLMLGTLIQCFEWERNSDRLVDMEEDGLLTTTKAKSFYAKLRTRRVMSKLFSQI